MKVKTGEKNKTRKVKDKETFVASILEKLSSILKKQPNVFLKDKFKKLDLTEKHLLSKDRKLNTILEKTSTMKAKVQGEIDKLNKTNIMMRTKLNKQLGAYEKGKSSK